MKGFPELDRKRAGLVLLSAILLISVYLAAGVQFEEARGTCYTEKRICHGAPIGNSCIGLETSEKVFDEQCGQIGSIEDTCTSLRQSLPEEWRQTHVEGFSCGFWDRKYDLGLKEETEG